MNKKYYETIDGLEKSGVCREYILGWMGGYLGNPSREEQRVTEAYSVGYEDAQNQSTDNAKRFEES